MRVQQAGGAARRAAQQKPGWQQGGAILSLAWRKSAGIGFLAARPQGLRGPKKATRRWLSKKEAGWLHAVQRSQISWQ